MDFGISSLCETLNQFDKIIIYGTGHYAQAVYPYLVQEGLSKKILCFTQTEESECKVFDNVPIVNIKELNCNKAECVVLIAVSRVYENAIKRVLSEYQYFNFVFLENYVVDRGFNEKKFYDLHTYEEYCETIVDWYLKTHIQKTDREMLMQELMIRGTTADDKKDSNLIVMICGHVSIRSNKIIGALKKRGYQIIMLHYFSNGHTWCIENLQKLNITIYKCQYIEEMLYKALQYKPLVYLFEPRWGDCLWAEIMIRNKEYFGKIVLSLYDILNAGYSTQTQDKLDTEKYSLEHADGIVWKWFVKDMMEKKGFHFRGKSILFLDYCNDVKESSVRHLGEEPDLLKLCVVVGFGYLFCTTRECETKYTCLARLDEVLDKIGNRDDCILHLYVGTMSEQSKELCKQCERKFKNFKFFLNTEQSLLLEKLCDYDYACNLYIKGELPPDDLIIDDMTGAIMRCHARNTFFDYLSAGLPMIATMPQKYLDYVKEYDVVVRMDVFDLDIDYLKKNKHYYKEKAKIAGKKLNIDNEIGRLIDFFKYVSYIKMSD